MTAVTLTSKGQLTLPRPLAEAFLQVVVSHIKGLGYRDQQ